MDLFLGMATFVRVVEAGSLSAAARQLRLSPAAVSRQLAGLEDDVGAPLVARTTRRMSVTEAGKRYYERCVRILREVEEARSVGGRVGIDGALAVSAPVTFGLATVAPRLRALVLEHPALRLHLRIEDRLIDLSLEGVDIAIRVGSPPPPSAELVAHRLCAWRRVLVASPAYLKKRGDPKTPAALARHDVLTHGGQAISETWRLARGDEAAQVQVNVRCSTNAAHALRDLAIDGAGIAALPPWFVDEAVRAQQLRVALPGWGSEPIVAHVIYRAAHRTRPQVRTVIDHLRTSYVEAPLADL